MKFCALLVALSFLCPQSGHDPALERLEKSPRHHEWVDVKRGERTVRCFVAYSEVKQKVPAVLVIHENKGLNDWVRAIADDLAQAGYVAIAPDLLSSKGPDGGNTESFKNTDAARQAIYALEPGAVAADLATVADHVLALPACDGTLSVAGFCWGGAKSFDFATRRKGLKAAFVFYGSAPDDEAAFAKIDCPVYGFYGESDARITEAVPATAEAMKKAGKQYEPEIYAGAGHGFLRAGEAADASEANKKACVGAWARWKKILSSERAK